MIKLSFISQFMIGFHRIDIKDKMIKKKKINQSKEMTLEI